MIKWFIRHQFKEMFRSTVWQKNLILNIILGFFLLLIFLEVLIGGIVLADKFQEIFPDEDPVKKFNGFLLYYFTFDLVLRYFMQKVPIMSVQPYLHLPVKRSSLINYVLSKSLLSFFNFLPLIFVIPMAFFQFIDFYPLSSVWIWIISIFLIALTNNFLIVYLKKQLVANPKVIGIFGIVLAFLVLFDYLNIISFSAFSTLIFGELLNYPLLIFVPAFLLIFVYSINYFFLKSHLYPEEIKIRKDKKVDAISNIKYLKTLGKTGTLVSLELKLWWRHKRTKTIIYMLPLFLLYGFFLYPQEKLSDGFGFFIFVGVFISGGMMLNYTNYAFSYESNYFDAILANNINIKEYLKVKLVIAIIISTFCFIVTIPYVFYGYKILIINFAAWLYCIGCLSFVLLYTATYNKKRMDLTKGAAFNYQGIGATNWLAMLPAFLLPIFIYLPFGLTGIPYTGILLIGLIGLIGLLFQKSLLNIIVKQFFKRKYLMADGFRQR